MWLTRTCQDKGSASFTRVTMASVEGDELKDPEGGHLPNACVESDKYKYRQPYCAHARGTSLYTGCAKTPARENTKLWRRWELIL